MPRDYPTTIELDENAKTIEFADGLELYVRAGSIEETPVEVTVDREDGVTIDDASPVTKAYVFQDFRDAETGEELEDVPVGSEKPIVTVIPSFAVDTTQEVALNLHTAPEGYPGPDDWTPRTGVPVDPVESGELMVELDAFQTFQINDA